MSSLSAEGHDGLEFIHWPAYAASSRAVLLQVDIRTAEVLVNRLAEVLGPAFAAYSRESGFHRGAEAAHVERERGS